MRHLCKTCIESFAECNGKPIFSIDLDPSLRGADADRVVECDQYNGPDECPKCGNRGTIERNSIIQCDECGFPA